MWRPILLLLACCWARGACGRSRLLDGKDPLGSPGELAWQAWLLMDGASAGSEAGGARRITPKSVFIAPAFAPQSLPPCADGTKRDAAGRCVQLVHINRDAQLNFLLQRLNALHGRPSPAVLPAPPPRRPPPPPAPPLAPQRAPDAGPLKVPLRVPLPTSTTTAAAPLTTPEDVAAPSSTPPPPTEPSVVMVDVSKRSSAEEEAGTKDPGVVHVKPMITVWTLENNTLHKSQDVEGDETTFSVEIPTTTTEVTGERGEGEETADEVQTPPKDVLAPSEVEDALPMLVISSGAAPPATPPTPATTLVPESEDDRGSSERSPGDDGTATVTTPPATERDGAGRGPTTEERKEEEEENDDAELGSADVVEQIEVVPISEHSRHKLPIMGEDQDSSFGHGGSFAGLVRQVPLDVMHSSQSAEDAPYPAPLPVRFPTDDSGDEPHTVHLFKGNFVKFPPDEAYRYKHRPATEPLADVKPGFWWPPSSWRIDPQRFQSSLQDFWSRMPVSEDSALLSQYNPSYHSPLPYQQRQAQYDPQWSTMKKQMTS